MRAVALVAVLAVVAGAACTRTLPPAASSASLYRDLERMVTLTAAEGWDVDRLEVDGLLSTALGSVCHVPPARRDELAAWLDAQITARGGPVDAAWRARGKKLSRVETLLTLTRVRALLGAAIAAAPADCPFWVEPSEGFDGRQITDDRWILSLEGGGKGIVSRRGDEKSDVTGGGAGRLLVGRGLGSRFGLHAGLELGGSADFPRDAMGMRTGLVFAFDVVTPLVARFHLTNSYFEVETGYLMHFTEADTAVTPGLRFGAAFGARALRRRWLIPGAAFAVSYDRTFPDDGTPALHLVKIGVRVTIDIAR